MKSIFLLLFLVHTTYAQFQTVSIGKIDSYYANSLSKEQLIVIVEEIEYLFESQLGFNVFDYAEDGKPIDIIYLPPSTKKKRLLRHIKKIESLKNKMNVLHINISKNKKLTQKSRELLSSKYLILNQSIENLNTHITKVQQTLANISKKEYLSIEKDISHQKKILQKQRLSLKKQKKKFNKKLTTSKQKVRKYNLLVKRYNKANRDAEKLSSTLIETKGVTKSKIKTTYIDNIKNTTNISMQKIEIYSFESMQQLKVVLAHEIGHLVGVQHINILGALMNPLVQKEQLDTLFLTYDDIDAFYKAFKLTKNLSY